MIGKTTIGSSFGGCVRYQFEGHKNSEEQKRAEILAAVGVRDGSPAQMIADFNRGRRLNPDLGKAVWHTSISFNPDDAAKLTSEKMLAVAQDYIKGMGLDQTQYVVIRHHDQSHPHFHLIANRVDNEGKTISDSHNYARSQALLKELSRQHGLTQLVPAASVRCPRVANVFLGASLQSSPAGAGHHLPVPPEQHGASGGHQLRQRQPHLQGFRAGSGLHPDGHQPAAKGES